MQVNEEANHIQPLVSVVVPVYQAESYLSRCLDSILTQTFTDFEVILVDDGSKDNSGKICDLYAENDNRFHVIHKINEGVSIARQLGLDISRGNYVIHADPDDWVEQDWLAVLYEKIEAEQADIVICDFERIYSNKKVHYVQCPTSLQNEDILDDMLKQKVWGSTWNKLVRKDCFDRYDVSFHPRMNLWEDLYVMCLLIAHGAKVSYFPKVLYHYDTTINKNSIVMNYKESNIRSNMIFVDALSPILSSGRFSDGWFYIKSNIKEKIFLTNSRKYNVKRVYEEINERYIQEASMMPLSSRKRCVAICLQTNSFVGHFVYSTLRWIKKRFISKK